MPDGDAPSYAKLLDLVMLVLLGGKKRTQTEWRDLLAAGGFELLDITPAPAATLIVAAPARTRESRVRARSPARARQLV